MQSGAAVDAKLLGIFLRPSWLSGLVSVIVGVAVVSFTVLLTHVGTTVQQSLIGLHSVYNSSSVGHSVQTVTNNFAQNTVLNNILLFLMWGSIGLLVYSIVQGIASELREADRLLRELEQAPASRSSILHNLLIRGAIRLIALICWWLLFRFTFYKLIPHTIGMSHVSAIAPMDTGDWISTILAALGCMVSIHVLTFLLRLIFMRPRLLSSDVIV